MDHDVNADLLQQILTVQNWSEKPEKAVSAYFSDIALHFTALHSIP